MEATELYDIFIKIIRSELTETGLEASIRKKITPQVVAGLYKLSKKQNLTHMVASSLYKHNLLNNSDLLEKFNQAEALAICKNEQMKYAYSLVCKIFDEAGIEYIPLKGSVIRPFYPKETMRTSCDIDILIKEEKLKKAVSLLENKGFKFKNKNQHDISLFFSDTINLELHFNIKEMVTCLDNVLKDVWNYATLKQGCCYELSKDFFVFHQFAHMAYHFVSGGCGVKTLMDVWIMKHKMGLTYLDAKTLLKKAEIYQFAEKISILVEDFFTVGAESTSLNRVMKYIMNGGSYGTEENKLAFDREKASGIVHYYIKRLFKPYREMVAFYPVLQKAPVLLPFCWIIRIIKMFFIGKFKKSVTEMRIANKTSDEKLDTIRQMRENLGLKF